MKAIKKSDFTRKIKAEADLKEERAAKVKHEREQLELSHIVIDDVGFEWQDRVKDVSKSLNRLSKQILSHINDIELKKELKKALSAELKELIEQYARHGKYTPSSTVGRRSRGCSL